jgi:glycerol-3-phosphate dehydrogenase
MAEDCVNQAITLGGLKDSPCVTFDLRIHGYHEHPEELGELRLYGTDADGIRTLSQANPALAQKLHPDLPYVAAEIVWGARYEMSRTVDDALARRTRALLLNARAAAAIAPKVARLLAEELGREEKWEKDQVASFTALAQQYILVPAKQTTEEVRS